MVMLFSVYFGLKGFVTPFGTGAGLMFYFRNHVGVSATDLQVQPPALRPPPGLIQPRALTSHLIRTTATTS
jgi:hypothetical protein